MHEDELELLEIKIKKLDSLLELDDLLIEVLEKDEIDAIPALMQKKMLIINEIKGIDKKLKDDRKGRNFSEHQKDKFRYIRQRLIRLKRKEEKLLHMAREKMNMIEDNLIAIEEMFRVKNKYREMRPKKNIFERVG